MADRAIALFTVAAVPAYVASQVATLHFGLPGREVFNAWALLTMFVVGIAMRRRLVRDRASLAVGLVLTLAVFGSTLVNGLPGLEVLVRGSLPYVAFVAAFLACQLVAPERRWVRLGLQVAAITAVASAVAAVIQIAFGRSGFVATFQDLAYPQFWTLGRAVGLVANPSGYAQLGVLWIALSTIDAGSRRVRLTLAILGGAAVGLGVSRTFSIAIAALFILWWVTRERFETSRFLAVGAVAAAVAMVLTLVFSPAALDNLLDRTSTVVTEIRAGTDATVLDGQVDATTPPGDAPTPAVVVDTRVAAIRATMRVVQDRPVLGAGPGRFGSPTAFNSQSPVHDEYDLHIPRGASSFDVGWAQITGELGLVGLAGVIAAFALLGLRALRTGRVAGMAIVFLLLFAAATGPGITDMAFTSVALWWYGVSRLEVAREPEPTAVA